MSQADKIAQAAAVLAQLGLPRAQQNERSALCLLALAKLKPEQAWRYTQAPLMGVTPIIEFAREHYGKVYAPNTRETIRKDTLQPFVAAGLARYNPDDPGRAVNSPKAVYQLTAEAAAMLKTVGSPAWEKTLAEFLARNETLVQRYGKRRKLAQVQLTLADGKSVHLSPGAHSQLIAEVLQSFGPAFAPGSRLIYLGDTGEKWGYRDDEAFAALNLQLDSHGKMPDVILLDERRRWLFLIESVTSSGPVNPKRYAELSALFTRNGWGCVYVTAFPNRKVMARYVGDIAWETEVWVADSPEHLIHFNGDRFLGPR